MTHYYHFVQVDDTGTPRLGYEDGREAKVGETLTVTGEPVLCKRGLHASAKLWDALRYASGDRLALTLVTLGGTIVHDTDKSVATERTVVAMLDADATEKLLRDWGRWCALQVIHLWDAPDVVRQYLETGDESLRAAAQAATRAVSQAASQAATWAAAWAAAWDAAWAAAWDATRAAAWDATRDAAQDAAQAAARAATWDAARAAAWDAAQDAAWDAAQAAAIESYTSELERRARAAMQLPEQA